MKLKHLLLGVLAAAALPVANAALITNSTVYDGSFNTGGSPVIDPADANVLGFKILDPSMSGDAQELEYMKALTGNSSLTLLEKQEPFSNPSESISWDFSGPPAKAALYVLIKDGGFGAGITYNGNSVKGSSLYRVYQVTNSPLGFQTTGSGTVAFDVIPLLKDKDGNVLPARAISHVSFFGGDRPEQNTPEGGATLVLLGLGLAGLSCGRRFLKKA